jgi:hypothetical protein
MATLTTTEILADTLEAFKAELPMLGAFSTDFSNARSKKGETIIAHVSGLPTVQDYDATNGFKPNATAADSLLTDVPVVLGTLKHVPIKVPYLTQLASRKDLYAEAVRNYAYVLSKSVIDAALALAKPLNFSNFKTESINNTTLETLESVRGSMNTNKAANRGRFGIVNTAFAGALQNDQRISSNLFYGQLNGASGYRTFKNLAGFENVWEYPDMPANAANVSGFFGDRRAVTVAARVPNVGDAASELGIPSIAKFETIQDPDTGMTFLGIGWQEAGTFDTYLTVAILYGVSAGNQGGAAGAITDNAGYYTKTA